ncbi:MAG: YggT family protein [bacterium]
MADAGAIVVNAVRLYEFVLIVRVFLSWVPHAPGHPVIRFVCAATDPLLNVCRELVASVFRLFGADTRSSPVDFSPVLAFLFIEFVVVRIAALLVSRF